MKKIEAQVLVVGAGPVGLTMAAELARHGVCARVVDKLVEPLPYCRATGVTPRTLEVYDDMGIAREMIDAGHWLEGMDIYVAGAPPREVRVDLSDLPFGNLGIRQPETERVLGEHLARFGVEVERGVTLAELSQDEEGVTVLLVHPEGRRETARFAYVVGCDGAHSSVRKALGIAFEGEAYPVGFMLGEVTVTPPAPPGVSIMALGEPRDGIPEILFGSALPEHGRYRVSAFAPEASVSGGTEHGIQEQKGPSLATLQAAADKIVPGQFTFSDLTWSSTYRISMRLAATYRVGRAFLAGDAAHIHPPTGGQGMNTGIQDAYNLAWKLGLVLAGRAGETLLESYDAERRTEGANVLARTIAATQGLGQRREKPNRLADTQLLVAYEESPIVRDSIGIGEPLPEAAPRAGQRAPEATGLARRNVGHPLRMFDLLRGTEHVLVCWLDRDAGADDVAEIERFAGAVP